MIWKKIFLDTQKKKYCIVKLFKTKIEMQNFYFKVKPNDTDHFQCRGVSIHYTKISLPSRKASNETGTVLLNFEECGAGLIAHELLHAVLWAL